jgi:hypothetical protein
MLESICQDPIDAPEPHHFNLKQMAEMMVRPFGTTELYDFKWTCGGRDSDLWAILSSYGVEEAMLMPFFESLAELDWSWVRFELKAGRVLLHNYLDREGQAHGPSLQVFPCATPLVFETSSTPAPVGTIIPQPRAVMARVRPNQFITVREAEAVLRASFTEMGIEAVGQASFFESFKGSYGVTFSQDGRNVAVHLHSRPGAVATGTYWLSFRGADGNVPCLEMIRRP